MSKRIVLVLFLWFGFIESSLAQDPQATAITYKYIDSAKYEVSFYFYRGCKGIAFNGPNNSFRVRCVGGSGTKNLKMTLKSIKDVTPVCSIEPSRCNPSNTYGTGDGIEEHLYTCMVDFNDTAFNAVNTCDEVVFEFDYCCRNGSISTGAANANYYNMSILNRKYGEGNSSTQLLFPPNVLVFQNQSNYFNVGLTDVYDKDSVSYSLELPHSSYATSINYTSSGFVDAYYPGTFKYPYNNPNANPPIGIYLDEVKGDIVFTAVKQQMTVLVLRATEWKKDSTGTYRKVGVAQMDQLLTVSSGGLNNSPNLSMASATTLCEGEKICFNVTTSDKVYVPPPPASAPPPDTTLLKWGGGITGATLQIIDPKARNKSGTFCWIPPVGSAKTTPYLVNFETRDNACPINSVSRKTTAIYVKPRMAFKVQLDNDKCRNYAYSIQVDSTIKEKATVQVVARNQLMEVVTDSTILKFNHGQNNSTYISDTIQFFKPAIFYLVSSVKSASYCETIKYDTIEIKDDLPELIELEDTFYCEGQSIMLLADVYAKNTELRKIKWHTGNLSDTNSTVSLSSSNPHFNLKLTAMNKAGCEVTDFVEIFAHNQPLIYLGNDTVLCGNYQLLLKAPSQDVNPWYTMEYTWQDASKADTLLVNSSGLYHVNVSNICGNATDSIWVYDKQNILRLNQPIISCVNKADTLIAQLKSTEYLWNTPSKETTNYALANTAGVYTCRMLLSCLDTVYETFHILKATFPNLILPDSVYLCKGTSIGIAGGSWDEFTSISWEDQSSDSIRIIDKPGFYGITANNACGQFIDSMQVKLKLAPIADLGNDTLFCSSINYSIRFSELNDDYVWQDSSRKNEFIITQPGKYWVSIANTCGNSSDTLIVSQSFVPQVNLGNDTLIKLPFSLVLDAQNTGAKYYWSTMDTSRTIIAAKHGIYWVNVNTPCGNVTDTLVIGDLMGISLEYNNRFRVYPNPARSELTIESFLYLPDYYELIDVDGKIVSTGNWHDKAGNLLQINLNGIATGSYNLRLFAKNEGVAHFKVEIIK